jgi:hypothetical protein
MKRHPFAMPFLLFIILFQAASLLPGQSYHTSPGIDTISALYPRYENSSGETAAVELILEFLDDQKIDYNEFSLEQEQPPSGSRLIRAVARGSSPGLGTVFFVLPLNHPFQADRENDYSAGIDLALSIISAAAKGSYEKSIEVLFLGGEFPPPGTGAKGFVQRGSSAFLNTFYPSEDVMFIYLNLSSPPEELALIPAGSGRPSPSWLYSNVRSALENAGIPISLDSPRTRLYRLDLQDEPSLIDPYLKAGYPVIELRTGKAGNPMDIPYSSMHLLLQSIAGEEAIPSYQDNHYLLLNTMDILPGIRRNILISEHQYITFLLLVFAGALAYPIIAVSRFRKYLKTLIRHIWSLPLLAAFMFLFLFIATLLMRFAGNWNDVDNLWEIYPFSFLWFKVAVSALLFILSQRLFNLLPFSRRGSFYSASALFFILTDILLVSLFDIDITAFLISTFMLVFLFTTVRNRIIKLIFFLLSVIPVVLGLYGIFNLPAYRAVHFILLSPVLGNLVVAVHLLPFLLMLIRLRYLFHHPSRKVTIAATLGLEMLMLSIALFFGFRLINADPFSGERRQPLLVHQEISGENTFMDVSVNSPADTDMAENFTFPVEKQPMEISLSSEPFLDRKSYLLTLTGDGIIGSLEIGIKSAESFDVLDASHQWTMTSDRRSAGFAIENFPSLPFTLELTLPGELTGIINITARYAAAPVDLPHFDEGRFDVARSFIFNRNILLE